MNNLTCALSGQCPIEDPVVTPTGQICSKKLLLQKLIETNYMNPFISSSSSAMPLDESQLVEIQNTTSTNSTTTNSSNLIAPPKQATSNSIPSLLNNLSSEYDSLVLELYDTRKALEETRKELSVALYQNDAAVRVIARVVLERDLARRQLAENVTVSAGNVSNAGGNVADVSADVSNSNKRKREDVNVVEEDTDVKMAEEPSTTPSTTTPLSTNQIPAEHAQKLQTKWSELFKSRKQKMKTTPTYATLDTIASYTPIVKKYHKTTNKGITGLVSPLSVIVGTNENSNETEGENSNSIIVSSGKSDKQLIWYNTTKHQIEKKSTLKKTLLNASAYTSKGTRASDYKCLDMYDHVTAYVTTDYVLHVDVHGTDGTGCDGGEGTLELDNQEEIVGVCVHPTCQHVFISTESGNVHIVYMDMKQVEGTEGENESTELVLENVATLKGLDGVTTSDDNADGNDSENIVKCTCMGLHPDGLLMALGRNDGKISVWDLKTEKLGSTLEGSSQANPKAGIHKMTFSEKGYHVAVSTNDGFVTIWDLRKPKIVATISTTTQEEEGGDGKDTTILATALSFDPIGKHFAYGTSHGKIVISTVKDLEKSIILNKESGTGTTKGSKVTGLVWGKDAQSIITSLENDRGIKFWGLAK